MRARLLLVSVVLLLGGLLTYLLSDSPIRGPKLLDALQEEPPLLEFHETQPLATQAARALPEGVVAEVVVEAQPLQVERVSGLGRLRVRVDRDAAGTALPSVRLALLRLDQGDGEDVRFLDISKGSERNAALTDLVGRSSFEVLAGVDWTLYAWEEFSGAGRREYPIPAFRDGETRDLRIVWERRGGIELRGRILQGGSNLPLPGAEVLLASGDEIIDRTLSSSEGLFSVWVETESNSTLYISASGYNAKLVSAATLIPRPQSDPDALLEAHHDIRLMRAASLEVRVFRADGSSAPPGLPVVLALDSKELESELEAGLHPAFQTAPRVGRLDASGSVLFEDVPSGTSLLLSLAAPHLGPSKRLSLLPTLRKQVSLEWQSSELAKLRGVLSDSAGAPIAGQELWLVAGQGGPRYFEFDEVTQHSTHSDKQGRFVFEEVLPGSYWVGPGLDAGVLEGELGSVPSTSTEVAPLATALVLEAGKTATLSLALERGLYCRGRLVDRESLPVPGARLSVVADEIEGQPPIVLRDEEFLVGPLMHGEHRLQALHEERGLLSDWTAAESKKGGRILHLFARSGILRGVVWNAAQDKPAAAWVYLTPRGEALIGQNGSTLDELKPLRIRSQEGTGAFAFEGLAPGEYSLGALVPGEFSSIPLIVPLGSQNGVVEGVRLTLQPAAYVNFGGWEDLAQSQDAALELWKQAAMEALELWTQRPRGSLEIWSEGSLLERIDPESYLPGAHQVPPGRLRLVWGWGSGGGSRKKEFELEPGEERKISF